MNRLSILSSIVLTLATVVLILPAAGVSAQASIEKAAVSDDLRAKAGAVILNASRSDDARLRLASLEAVSAWPERARPMADLAMKDDNPAVRFAALVTVGKLQLEGFGDSALAMTQDPNPSVRAAALFAASRCGKQVDLSPLAKMLASDNPSARGNAAMLLGMMDDRGAKPMLKEMAAIPMPRVAPAEREWVRLQFAEAMVKLDPNDEEVMDAVRAAVYSNYDDIRVLGIQIVGAMQDRSMQRWLEQLIRRENPVQVKIAAASALAQMNVAFGEQTLLQSSQYSAEDVQEDIRRFLAANRGGDGEAYQSMRDLANDAEARAGLAGEVRAQAAFGLGYLGNQAALTRLEQMLADPQPIAAVAAAGAILRAREAGN